jgi:hypothetical protein
MIEPRDSPSIELTRILTELDRSRRRAQIRSLKLIDHAHPTSTESLLIPLVEPAPSVAVRDTPEAAAVSPAPFPSAPASPVAPASPTGVARLRGLARPVSTVVLTTTFVLLGWLLVLEPALGSRPVLVMDDGMSPALRVGDVAFAEDPSGPLVSGAIVAVRIDGRVDVTRLIDREQVPPGASAETRADAPLVVRDDAEGLEVRVIVARDEMVGVIGAAVPRVGLPVVWLRSPTSAPLGTLFVLLLLGVTAVGATDALRERTARRRSTVPSP